MLLCYCGLFSADAVSVQYSVKSDITADTRYNDNVFLTTLQHDSVSSLSIAPSVKIDVKDINWESYLNGRVKDNKYSDKNFDSTDEYLDLSGKYTQEKNIYTLSGAYDKDSNLNIESTDFGVTGKRVNRNRKNLAPQFQRLLSERLVLSVGYDHTDVDYTDAIGTAYVPYGSDTVNGSLIYGVTENDKISILLQAIDYASKNDAYKYKLSVAKIGIDHKISEIWASNFSIGTSRRSSTNRSVLTYDFFGQPIVLTQVSDFTDRGFVLDAGLTETLETGSLNAVISRNDVTNSYGGLNEVSSFRFKYNRNLSVLWRYDISVRYEKIRTVSGVQRSTDRDALFFVPQVSYKIDRDWRAIASYQYIQQRYRIDSSDNRTADSNMIYIGMTYSFPDISTF